MRDKITKLNFKNNKIESNGIYLLRDKFNKLQLNNITYLNLESNNISDLAGSILIKTLSKMIKLQHLVLSKNQLGSKSAIELKNTILLIPLVFLELH